MGTISGGCCPRRESVPTMLTNPLDYYVSAHLSMSYSVTQRQEVSLCAMISPKKGTCPEICTPCHWGTIKIQNTTK